MVDQIIATILLLTSFEGHNHTERCKHTRKAVRLAPIIAEVFSDDSLLATKMMGRESSFRMSAVGPKGSRGLMQIKPVSGDRFCKELQYATQVRDNMMCGKRIMKFYRTKCRSTDPAVWLSAYNGRRCGRSKYSQRVLSSNSEPQQEKRP